MNIALILAGGTGSRMNADIPKQYIKVNNKMIIEYCLETIFLEEMISGVIIVADDEWRELLSQTITSASWGKGNVEKFLGYAKPGKNRQLSIYEGLKLIRENGGKNDDVILIHDAARPMLTKDLINNILMEFNDENVAGVLPVIKMKDTIYFCDDGKNVSRLLDRNKLFAGQAPEAFLFEKYLKANEDLLPDKIMKINGSSEPAIIAGMTVRTIDGDENNFKITTQNDLERFKGMI